MNLDPGTATMTAEDYHADLYGEEYEPIAPLCPGPGHLFDHDERGFDIRIEDCPACANGPIRNHNTRRDVE